MLDVTFYILLLVFVPKVFTKNDKYCAANLCEKGETHIACKNDEKFGVDCNTPEIISITLSLRKQIVSEHNKYRNIIAEGFKKFPPASSMATMVWNNELAELAVYNVIQCKMEHDCHNTETFKCSGQNLASSCWMGMNKTISENINANIENWFNEHNNCPVSIISNFSDMKGIGHFTAMVQEKSTDVGCAILSAKKDGRTCQYMACNYAYSNLLNHPVYPVGKTASNCKKGRNNIYKSLCSENEKYNVNE